MPTLKVDPEVYESIKTFFKAGGRVQPSPYYRFTSRAVENLQAAIIQKQQAGLSYDAALEALATEKPDLLYSYNAEMRANAKPVKNSDQEGA